MSKERVLLCCFLAGDLAIVFLICRMLNRYWKIPKNKMILGAFLSVPAGLIGSSIIRRIEFGTWTGLAYFGVILIAPVIMVILGLLLKIEPETVLGMGAPIACAVLPLMKLQCLITGCCFGRIIRRLPNGRVIRFPSQLVEMICGIILLLVVLKIEQSEKQRKYIYAWFLFLYGCSRFVLNMFRDTVPFLFGLSGGCVWSIIAICIGGGVLLAKHRKEVGEGKGNIRPKRKRSR